MKDGSLNNILLNPSTLVRYASEAATWQEILKFHQEMATDIFIQSNDNYYRKCLDLYEDKWFYLDIVNVLYTSSKLIKPQKYLEIGVRRGRSACTVAKAFANVDIYAFDMWIENYAGVENPGPAYVKNELSKHGHQGNIYFYDGDSHVTIPKFFEEHPDVKFDLINVDGDHTAQGAYDDLINVIPHLAVGGILVFDDICHPSHRDLLDVWGEIKKRYPDLSTYEYAENGNGVAFAIKLY